MNYLITGGTGFLGSYVAKQLLEKGQGVVLLSRSAPMKNSMSEVLTRDQIESLKFEQGNVKDLARIVHVCQDNAIDIIIHPAALLLSACEANPLDAVQTNIMGLLNVFEAARICGIKRVVWASSNSAIGNVDYLPYKQVSNDAPHLPVTIYGKAKDFDEFMGRFYHERYGLEAIALRYTVIYGKGRRRGGANYIKNMLNDPALGIASTVDNGDDSPNFIYVEDAARATVLAATVEYQRDAYNVTGESISMRDLRDYVLTLLPDAQIELTSGKMDIAWDFDTSVEERELGYRPEVGIREGALLTINDVRESAGLAPISAPKA